MAFKIKECFKFDNPETLSDLFIWTSFGFSFLNLGYGKESILKFLIYFIMLLLTAFFRKRALAVRYKEEIELHGKIVSGCFKFMFTAGFAIGCLLSVIANVLVINFPSL